MKKYIYFCFLALGLTLLSCGKDDSPKTVVENPEITGFTPEEGPVGTAVTINGKNFSTTAAANTVKIGTTAATVASATATKLIVAVPEGATTGRISVTVDDYTYSSAKTFTVTVMEEPEPKAESIALDKETLELYTNDNATLEATITGDTNSTITWSSDNTEILTVDDQGKLTALQSGSVTVTAAIDDKTATCTVTINPNIYVVGMVGNGTILPVLWKNGSISNLPITEGSDQGIVNSVFVSGSDVYAVGNENLNFVNFALLWKNGDPTILSEGNNYASANSVYVNGQDVYVVGYENNENDMPETKMWENNTAITLSDNAEETLTGESVFGQGDNVYVVGNRSVNLVTYPIVWENGILMEDFANIPEGIAISGYADGNDVYVVGSKGIIATVWKNGQVLYNLTNGMGTAIAQSVVVNDGNVYTVGNEGNIVYVWKNEDILFKLTEGQYEARGRSIQVYGEDIYVAGYENNDNASKRVAKVWKNGIAMDLTNDNTINSEATDIVIK